MEIDISQEGRENEVEIGIELGLDKMEMVVDRILKTQTNNLQIQFL